MKCWSKALVSIIIVAQLVVTFIIPMIYFIFLVLLLVIQAIYNWLQVNMARTINPKLQLPTRLED